LRRLRPTGRARALYDSVGGNTSPRLIAGANERTMV